MKKEAQKKVPKQPPPFSRQLTNGIIKTYVNLSNDSKKTDLKQPSPFNRQLPKGAKNPLLPIDN